MVTKFKEREKAISLRKRGLSYSEILQQVPVAKSSLSLWLHSVGLSKRQKQRLTEKKLASMRRGWIKLHVMRLKRWERIKKEARQEVKDLFRKERWIIGVMLYWAEGAKEKEYSGGSTDIKFSNSDPRMIKIFRSWLDEFFKISKEKMHYELYIHEKADLKTAKRFWSNALNVPMEQFRIYFKQHNPKPHRRNIGNNYHGLVRLYVSGSVDIVRKISGWIEGINDHFLYSGVV